MDWLALLRGTVFGGILLFLWSGITQNLTPWGIKSVGELDEQAGIGESLERISTKGLYYVKDKVAAFIAIKPETYYSMRRYFIIEFVTQVLVAAVLSAILLLTNTLSISTRLLLIGLVTLAGIFSIDLQYWNWWGFSNIYTVGVAVNRLTGYLLISFFLIRFIL
ncbi:hypothetical protein WA1_00910 [Scytonema hofmannii PCC 7110]|uniref:Uncharacterized protein n=1 Tax=Scytonema hofmannii PCC 7110 TaxID=128403 RepID=A0A139XGE0_9CYAN|nr:hypothetical protein [Scytonema hofmannii]KYC43757.1 hypothetical protein WA1_00910 [Scytonema hofmannii PCC 7110]